MKDYADFYGFSENPFNATPDLRFFFLPESRKGAFAYIVRGISDRKGIILILGEGGIGKTSLIQYLSDKLGEIIKAVTIDQPDISGKNLVMEISLKVGLPSQNEPKGTLIHNLNEYLIKNYVDQGNFVIFVDEAHRLHKEAIEELRLFSNLETGDEKLVQIVLFSQSEIVDKLNSKEFRQFKQRIAIRSEIRRLTEGESNQYIEHRLKVVGSSSSEVFTQEAMSLICRYAKGIPRAINTICDNCFRIGYDLSTKPIGSSIVKRSQNNFFKKIFYRWLMLIRTGRNFFNTGNT